MTKTPIEPGDILEGDTIRAEYITIMNGPSAHEYVANRSGELWVEDASHFLLDRPKPPVVLPTEPGSYSDSSGDLWIMGESGLLIRVAVQQLLALDGALEPYDHEKFGEPAPYLHAPFTKLEPVAETARKMRDAILAEFDMDLSYYDTVRRVAADFVVTS